MAKEIHYLWVGLSCLLIVFSKEASTASVREREIIKEHSFDLGPLSCCRRPKNSEVCPDISDYIPCTVVSEMDSREDRISSRLGNYGDFISPNCSDNLRDVLCEQSFPSCVINDDGSHEVQQPARETCEEKMDACPADLKSTPVIKDICSLYEPESTNYSVGNCSASNIALTHCTVDWYLPEWSRQYLQQIDNELDNMRETELSSLMPACWKRVVDFRCKSVGRCWAQGDRLEHINSADTCISLLSCIPDDLQGGYENLVFDCDSLPDEHDRLITQPTEITLSPPTTQSPPPVTTSPPVNSNPSPPEEVEGSTSASSASIPLVLLTLATALLAR